MTTFLQRSIDQSLRRSSRQAALGQWWTPKTAAGLRKIDLIGVGPAGFCKADGEQIWVGNGEYIHTVTNSGNDSVTLSRAADLSLIGNVQLSAGSAPFGACSDGINFWVTLRGTNELLRL